MATDNDEWRPWHEAGGAIAAKRWPNRAVYLTCGLATSGCSALVFLYLWDAESGLRPWTLVVAFLTLCLTVSAAHAAREAVAGYGDAFSASDAHAVAEDARPERPRRNLRRRSRADRAAEPQDEQPGSGGSPP
jgi:hypothetical protein